MGKIIKDISELDLNATYSYADYLNWHFEQSVELIKGHILGVQTYFVSDFTHHFYRVKCLLVFIRLHILLSLLDF